MAFILIHAGRAYHEESMRWVDRVVAWRGLPLTFPPEPLFEFWGLPVVDREKGVSVNVRESWD